jgi:hypothetical protein
MKTDMIYKNILQALTGLFVVSVLMVGAFAITPLAHAQQQDGGDYSEGGCGCGGGSSSLGTDSVYPADTGSYSLGTNSVYPASAGSYSTGVDYAYPASTGSYSTGTNSVYPANTGSYSTGTSYSTPVYSTGGYSTGGYSTGGYSTGGYMAGGYNYSTPGSNVYAPTNVNTNVNNNTCTGNSCNTTVTNPAPIINNVVANYGSTNTAQYCASGYYGTYPNCYINQPVYTPPVVYQAPVAYNAATPYITLSQVPYTGLDLGFWGTIAYWGFMIGFALVVAYLIAIKRVQNSIARSIKYFLFGSIELTTSGTASEDESEAVVVTTPAVQNNLPAQTSEDTIDSFILSQINRPRHA